MKTVATAIGEGLAAGIREDDHEGKRCLTCNQENDADASICKNCGASSVHQE